MHFFLPLSLCFKESDKKLIERSDLPNIFLYTFTPVYQHLGRAFG
jgi:hypothetical protein